MGMMAPCLFAAILNGCAVQLFREPMKIGDGPLLALYIFIFAAFVLLWSVRLLPSNLRKIGKLQFLIEFFIAEFLMEAMIVDFWFPMEKNIHDSLPTLAQIIEDWLSSGDWSADVIVDFLKSETTLPFLVSYSLSLFFLLAILQASRVVDFTILREEGVGCFVKQLKNKLKIGLRKIGRQLGLVQRRVQICEGRNTHRSFCKNSSEKRRHCNDGGGRPLDFEDMASLSDYEFD